MKLLTTVAFNDVLMMLLLIVVKIDCPLAQIEVNETFKKFSSKSERSAPALLFPIGTSTGIAVALAFPISDESNNLFVSYNFEMNYNMVNIAQESFPGPLVRLKLTKDGEVGKSFDEKLIKSNRILLTRIGLYRVIESRLNA